MLRVIIFTLLVLPSFLKAQKAPFIPNNAQFVLSISGEDILKDVPLEEMEKYEFMAEVSKELFRDASKSISEFGFDLNGQFYFFGGDLPSYNFFGFSIDVADMNKLIDNMKLNAEAAIKLRTEGFYFNNSMLTAIRNNQMLFVVTDLHYYKVNDYVDSIYYANGWMDESRYYNDYYYEEQFSDELDQRVEEAEAAVDEEMEDFIPPAHEVEYEEFEIVEEQAIYEAPPATMPKLEESINEQVDRVYEIENLEEVEEIVESEPTFPSKYTFRDSVETAWIRQENDKVLADFLSDNSLFKHDEKMQKAFSNGDQAVFFFDASKFYTNSYELERELKYNPIVDKNSSIFKDQWYHAVANFTETGIHAELDMNGHTEIIEVVDELGNSKMDKEMLKYIPDDNMGFVIGNASYQNAYERFKSIYLPKLENSSEKRLQLGSAIWYTWDRMMNKDVLFELYSGRMFMTFNGFKELPTQKISYEYDEVNFEYKEVITESKEVLPVFTLGISTEETEIALKYLEVLSKTEQQYVQKKDGYYVITSNEFNIPIYVYVYNNLFIASNDLTLVLNSKNGLGSNRLKGDAKKRAKKTNMLYAEVDYAKLLQSIPREYIGRRDFEMFQTMAGKVGKMEMSFDEVKQNLLKMKVNYTFNGDYQNGGYYMLDLINTLYLKATR